MSTFATLQHRHMRSTSRIIKVASCVLAAAMLSTAAQATTIAAGSTVTGISAGTPGAHVDL